MFTDRRALQVVAVPSVTAYDTLDAAIEGARRQAQESVATSKRITGARIEGISFSDTEAAFRLSNSRTVRLSATANGVEWSVVESAECKERKGGRFPRRLLLQYPRESKPLFWERAEILQRRVDHDFVATVSTDRNVFLYAAKCLPLLFCVLVVNDDGRQSLLLSWDEAE